MEPLSAPGGRVLVAKVRGLGGQLRFYTTAAGFECDQFAQGELARRRMFYDDVRLVTLHRSLGWPFLVTNGALAVLGGALVYPLGRENLRWGLVAFAVVCLPFLVAIALRLLLGRHAVTLYGRRNRLQLSFGLRETRARAVFDAVRRRVAEEQAPR